MSYLSDNDSGDDSDIETMLQKARKERKRKATTTSTTATFLMLTVSRQNSYDDDDDDDNDDDFLLRTTTTSHKKQKQQTVEQKLAALHHNMKISERRRVQNTMLQLSSNSNYNSVDDDDDGSDSDEDDIMTPSRNSPAAALSSLPRRKKSVASIQADCDTKEIIVLDCEEASTTIVPTTASQLSPAVQSPTRRSRRLRDKSQAGVVGERGSVVIAKRPPRLNTCYRPAPPTKQTSYEDEIEIFDSSSDEEEGCDNDEREISPETNAAKQRLAQLQKVRAQLEEQSTLDLMDDNDNIMIVGTTPRNNELLHITVEASVDTTGAGSATTQSITLTLPAESLLQELEQALLQELRLPCNGSTKCYFRIGSKRLLTNRTPSFYELCSPVTIQASLYVTDYGGNNRPNKAPATNFGPMLRLVLRYKNGTDKTVQYGLNQPFKDLMDDHGGTILQFDGERLSANQTPASLGTYLSNSTNLNHRINTLTLYPLWPTDMENEDLIDAI